MEPRVALVQMATKVPPVYKVYRENRVALV